MLEPLALWDRDGDGDGDGVLDVCGELELHAGTDGRWEMGERVGAPSKSRVHGFTGVLGVID